VTSVVTPGPRRASGSDLPRLAAAVWLLAGVVVLALLLVAGRYGLVGGHLWAFRVLPALAAGAYVLLGAP
jgi:hypothetical protein